MYQRKRKFHFFVTQKNNFLFCPSQIFYINFYISHQQHVDLLRRGPRNKETFNPSFTHLSNTPKQLLRSALEKKLFLLSRFNIRKTSMKGSYVIIAGIFLTTFTKINTVTGIFHRFYLAFNQFSIYAMFLEVIPVGRCRKF